MKKEAKKTVKNDTKVNKKKSKKIIVIIGIIAIISMAYLIYCLYSLIKNPSDVVIVENGSLYLEEDAIGYIIREETVLKNEEYKNGMVQIKTEGEKVAKDSTVFRYYSNNEEELIKKINELSQKIDEALTNENEWPSGDVKALEKQIEEKIRLININDIQKINEYKKDINSYASKKAKYVGELSPAGSYVRQLIDERSGYEAQLNSNSKEINAPVSGIVSYRVDGLEEVLTTNDFSNLSKKLLEDLNLKTGQLIASSNEKGKIINNFNCYIATVLDSEQAKKVELGDKVTIRLSTQDEVQATIEYIVKENEEELLIVLKITKCVEKLIDYRKISFEIIWWSENGLKVPNSAIIYDENELAYVIRNRAGYLDKILVKILKQNENYSIVERYSNSDLKELNINTKNVKNISLHDEILLNPINVNVE